MLNTSNTTNNQKKNLLAGRRGGGDGTTWTGICEICDIRFVMLESKCGCHSSPTATNWTKHVQRNKLEQRRMNHTCKRVLAITGDGSLSHRTCTPSDLTSISLSHTASPQLHRSTPKFPNAQFNAAHEIPNRIVKSTHIWIWSLQP